MNQKVTLLSRIWKDALVTGYSAMLSELSTGIVTFFSLNNQVFTEPLGTWLDIQKM